MLYLRLFNRDARTVTMMEKQLNTRIEILLEEERSYLERVEKEVAVRKSRVLYLADSEFTEQTLWRDKLPPPPP